MGQTFIQEVRATPETFACMVAKRLEINLAIDPAMRKGNPRIGWKKAAHNQRNGHLDL
jgi:hypothetical protein